MKYLLIAVIIFCVFLIFTLNHYFNPNISGFEVEIQQPHKVSKIDVILKKHLKTLKTKQKILKNFKHNPKTLEIKKLWVDKFEVKQGDFYKFIGWSRVNKVTNFLEKNHKFKTNSKNHSLSGKLKVSANGVSFLDASGYCMATKGRIATKDENRVIAGNNLYPWGDKFIAKPWVYLDSRLNSTLKAGSFKSTNTKEGVADFGSLLAEWQYDKKHKQTSIFGGNAYSKPYELYSLNAVSIKANKDYRSPYVGFRCVYDEKPRLKTPWGSSIKSIKIIDKKVIIDNYPNSKIIPLLSYLENLNVNKFKQLLPTNNKNYIIKYPHKAITVESYERFLNNIWAKTGIFSHPQEPYNHNNIPINWKEQLKNPEQPVIGVDFFSSYHFARWLGGRLPSHKEVQQIKNQNNDGISKWSNTIDSSAKNLNIIVYESSFLTDKTSELYRSIPAQSKLSDVGFTVIFDI
jgi:formylglycine-generating enzyme required for sulfatase activity